MTVFRDLFHVSPERAAEIMRKHGFVPLGEEQAAVVEKVKAEAAEREPLPFVETPDELKVERMANLQRRLQGVDFYGRGSE